MSETSQERTFKKQPGMESNLSFIRPSKLTAADAGTTLLEGIYLGAVPNALTKKDDYKFEKDDGSQVIINGAGNLGYQLSKIALNTVVQVNYNGRSKIAKGPMAGKEAHGFEVLVAE